ncbi:MAG: class I SAM-dependent methyltransferase [Burkholderiaceae bacterium]|nr:class I SAM-dependent methyltransferase [Burkholderiaceae bacterium]
MARPRTQPSSARSRAQPRRGGRRLRLLADGAANDAPAADAAPAAAPTGARWRWPLPALLTWTACWATHLGLQAAGQAASVAALSALLLGLGSALWLAAGGQSRWRTAFVAAGFPLSLLLQTLLHGAALRQPAELAGGAWLGSLPGWAWLLPLALLALAYPLRAWRDAPFFPTPADALTGLAEVAPLSDGARVLDAGCGLGHGLQALRRVYPQASFEGIEWSWPLRALAALRCPWARIRRGDMWRQRWQDQDLVYLFQRPESMARAADKARLEMRPGSWLVSLEFRVPGLRLHALLQHEDGRPVWVYAPAGTGAQR